jgi:hypothetical protein
MSMAFLLHLIGVVVFVSGLAWLATLAGIAPAYVTAGALVLAAIGVFSAGFTVLRTPTRL